MSKKDFEPDDWEGNESLVNNVMHLIDMSDIDGFTKEEADKYIKLLKSDKSSKILYKK